MPDDGATPLPHSSSSYIYAGLVSLTKSKGSRFSICRSPDSAFPKRLWAYWANYMAQNRPAWHRLVVGSPAAHRPVITRKCRSDSRRGCILTRRTIYASRICHLDQMDSPQYVLVSEVLDGIWSRCHHTYLGVVPASPLTYRQISCLILQF